MDAKILIVDDEARNLEALEAMLESTGCLCVRAESADEALLALLRHEFAAMVLDIRMPGMSGIDLAQLIKQRRRTQDVPILFLTAHLMDNEDVLRGYGVGAVDYLSKPVNPDILRSKIAVFVELYRKTQALARVNAALEAEVVERQRAQQALQQANQELELRVRERTAELMVALGNERRARDEAERQSLLKDEFLATLSHELRTPINVILGWLDILLSGKPVRELNSTLRLMQRNAQLQGKLIEDLLDMNRLISGGLTLDISTVDVSAALHTVMQGLKPAADAKNIQLVAAVDAPPVSILADSRRVQQIIWNILHNAIKFTEAGGRVESTIRRMNSDVQITVVDSGRGISAEFLPHVFERFRQENASTTREFFGLGLGLSITKHLVESHGGTIAALSDGPGRGATFTVRLPATSATASLPDLDSAKRGSAQSMSA